MLGLATAAAAPHARAERPFDPAYCGTPLSVQPDPRALAAREDPATPVEVEADQVEYLREEGRFRFSGDVLMLHADQQFSADRVYYDERSRRADAFGNVSYRESGLALWGNEGHLYFDVTRGALELASFQFEHSYAHGDADRILIDDAERTRYRNARFTTCPGGREDWWLRASRLQVDREEGLARASHARLEFFRVPMFYTPYISFPIDDRRRSGLLAPDLRHSRTDGYDIRIPYYLNLAPNYDAVLAPRLITERGLMLDTEWRLLTRSFSAETTLQYLPDDSLFGDDRWGASLQARSPRDQQVQWNLDGNRVSDQRYLRDLDPGIADRRTSHLGSRASASYASRDWLVGAEATTWQTVDPDIQDENYPYRTLPRVRLDHRPEPLAGGFSYRLHSEVTNFDHPFPELRDTGSRVHLQPTLSRPFEQLGYFVIPSIAIAHTEYWLDRADAGLGEAENPSTTLPIYTLDTGLFLERDLAFGGRALMQTLEPRLFYLYVPFADQLDQPVFDTSRTEPTLGGLFRTNRFTGPDRIGDANQVSAAVTSRFVDRASGREYLSLAAGQIFYFADREVHIDASPGDFRLEQAQRERSDIMAEARSRLPGGVSAFAEYQWDPYASETRRGGLQLRYQPQPTSVVNLAYRMRTDPRTGERDQEQTDLSFVWPIGFRLHGIGGWRYSLLDSASIEHFAGFEFDNCCWSLRVLARRYVTEVGLEPEREIMLQLEFTGLADVGRSVQDFMIDAVAGYRPRR